MNFLLHCNFDGFLISHNENYKFFAGLDQVVSLESDNLFFQVLSTKIGQNSYGFLIENKNNILSCDHPLVKLYNLDNKNYILCLNENINFETGKSLSSLSTISNDYEIVQNQKLELRCANNTIYRANFIATSASLETKYNLIFAKFQNENKKRIIVLDSSNNILIKDTISSFEYAENGFQTLLLMNDIHKHGLVKKYEIENDKLLLTKQYAVYINVNPKKIANINCAALAFFESIKAKNFTLAKQYLSNNLKQKITNEHFIEFFGDFDEIVDCSVLYNQKTFALISSFNKTHKVYNITLENNLIENIEPKNI